MFENITIQRVHNGYLVAEWPVRNRDCSEDKHLFVYKNLDDLIADLPKLLNQEPRESGIVAKPTL